MELLIYIIVFAISLFIFRLTLGMIILSLFFGIPQTLRLKKENVLLNDATIKPYLTTIIIWTIVIGVIFWVSFKIFSGLYLTEIIWGFIIAFILSLQLLSKKNYSTNMSEVLNVQKNYINSKFQTIEPDIETWQSVKERVNENNNLESLEENAPNKK